MSTLGAAFQYTEHGGYMKLFIFTIATLWALILTSEPALANCTYQTVIIDGQTRICTTCCYSGSGCTTSCS